jgi:hypothetical protein
MPSRVFEDVFSVEAALVEPVAFGSSAGSMAAYPLSQLRIGGPFEVRSIPVVVLENGVTRATVCPSLGGRVLFGALPARLTTVVRGPRDLWMVDGAQVSLVPGQDSMSFFDHLVHEPSEVAAPAAVMLFGSPPGLGLSLQVVYSLPPDSSELFVEARVFNRTLTFQHFGVSLLTEDSGEDIVSTSVLGPRDTRAFRFRLAAESVVGIEQNDVPNPSEVPNYLTSADSASLPIHLRGAAYVREAQKATLEGDLQGALGQLDSALATLGDDPLCWWHRAVIARLVGERDDDSPELANAHALSPLEPVLKAEAFLSMPQTHGKEPSAMLKSLAHDPDAMLECVHLYIEANLFAEASRLIDEALRHGEQPLLRYMNAWMLMTHTRMEMEAASEVVNAGKSPVQPPFPWRPLEVEAVEFLAQRFPNDERLGTLKGLLDKRSSPAT